MNLKQLTSDYIAADKRYYVVDMKRKSLNFNYQTSIGLLEKQDLDILPFEVADKLIEMGAAAKEAEAELPKALLTLETAATNLIEALSFIKYKKVSVKVSAEEIYIIEPVKVENNYIIKYAAQGQ